MDLAIIIGGFSACGGAIASLWKTAYSRWQDCETERRQCQEEVRKSQIREMQIAYALHKLSPKTNGHKPIGRGFDEVMEESGLLSDGELDAMEDA